MADCLFCMTSSVVLTMMSNAFRTYFSSAFGLPLTTLMILLSAQVLLVIKTSPRRLMSSEISFVTAFASLSAGASGLGVESFDFGGTVALPFIAWRPATALGVTRKQVRAKRGGA